MKYRTAFNDQKVLTSSPNDDNTVTSSNEQFIIDTIENSMNRLAAWGIDVSYFWKNGLAGRIDPERNEIPISNHPADNSVNRKAFVWFTSNRYKNRTIFCLIIRHFDAEGNHIPDDYDDEFVSRVLSNQETVDDGQGNQVPEYDFMYSLVESKAYSLFELEDARVAILDGSGVFGESIY